jgi:hypothetical protein
VIDPPVGAVETANPRLTATPAALKRLMRRCRVYWG